MFVGFEVGTLGTDGTEGTLGTDGREGILVVTGLLFKIFWAPDVVIGLPVGWLIGIIYVAVLMPDETTGPATGIF